MTRLHPICRFLTFFAVPPALLATILALSLMGPDHRLNLLIICCAMLGAGPVLMLHVYRRELRERDKAELALRSNERRYRSLVEMSPDAVAVHADGELLYSNRAWAMILGMPVGESLSGQLVSAFFHPNCRTELRDVVNPSDNSGEPWTVERRIRRLDGGQLDIEFTSVAIVHDGRQAIQTIARDITKRKQEQAKLEEALKAAEEATRLKSEFLATMSHEIRTPMNGVLGMVELLLGTPMDETQSTYSHAIRESAEALLNIINEILDLARIESGRFSLESEAFDLNDILNRTSGLISARVAEKGLRCVLCVDPQIPTLIGDGARIRQIVTNLLDNAVKFTKHGHVLVSADLEKISGEAASIRVSVKDTGIGIAPSKLDRIFEKFTQADSSTTRKFGGSGLGLAICRQLVELMGGRIGVRSNPGHGSEFWFELSLPVSNGLARLAESCNPDQDREFRMPKAADRIPAGIHVLVAEDNNVNRTVAFHMLSKLGCRVDVCTNGRDALEMFQKAEYDLVFMDCEMPEMDGYQATALIRSVERPGLHTPIVALTAHAMKGCREQCLEAGMDDYLSKPLDLTSMNGVLDRWIALGARHQG